MKNTLNHLLFLWLSLISGQILAQNPTVQLLAGSTGFLDSTLNLAQFRGPHHIIYNAANQTYYVADRGNFRVRAIKNGQVTTLAGEGQNGTTDGVGTASRFSGPAALALNSTGDTLFVADAAGNRDGRIRAIVLKGTDSTRVRTLAGASGGNPGPSNNPVGTAARFGGNLTTLVRIGNFLYTSDFGGAGINRLRRIQLSGSFPVTTFDSTAGMFSDTLNKGYLFGEIEGLCAGPGDSILFLAVKSRARIIRLNLLSGTFSTLAGTGSVGAQDGPFASATFSNSMAGLIWEPTGNDLYLMERGGNNQWSGLRRLDLDAQTVNSVAGGINASGSTDGPGTVARFANAQNLSIGSTGLVLVADVNNSRIRTYTPASGEVGTLAGRPDTALVYPIGSKMRLSNPGSVVVDRQNNVWFADRNSHTIRRINRATGEVRIVAGKPFVSGSANGPALDSARFNQPNNLALRGDSLFISEAVAGSPGTRILNLQTNRVSTLTPLRGELMVHRDHLYFFGSGDNGASFQNRIIRLNLLTGQRDTVAGTGQNGFTQGPGKTAQIFNPRTGAVRNDTLYFVTGRSSKPWRIRRIALNQPDFPVDTLLSRAQTDPLNNPSQALIDPFGMLYIANTPFNGGIFRVDLTTKTVQQALNQNFFGPGLVGMALDTNRNALIFAENTNNRIMRYRPLYSVANVAPSFSLARTRDTLFRTNTTPRILTGTAININANTTQFNTIQNQTVSFTVSVAANQQAFFAQPPTLSPSGELQYQLASSIPFNNTNNLSVNLTIRARDNGGVADGGVDSSATQTFVVVIRYQNLAPVFTVSQDTVTVLNTVTTTQTVNNFLTAVASGSAPEPGQNLTFSVSNDNASIFTTAPAFTGSGANRNLTYRPNGTVGLANVRVVLRDNGGQANGGVDSTVKTFVIRVTTQTSLLAKSQAGSFRVFPNPSTGILHLEGTEAIARWEMVSTAGQVLKKSVGTTSRIDVEDVPPGLYFLRIEEKSGPVRVIPWIRSK